MQEKSRLFFDYFQLFCKVNSIHTFIPREITLYPWSALRCYSVTAKKLPINTQKYSYIYIYKYKTFLRVYEAKSSL